MGLGLNFNPQTQTHVRMHMHVHVYVCVRTRACVCPRVLYRPTARLLTPTRKNKIVSRNCLIIYNHAVPLNGGSKLKMRGKKA
jgi:hypothetical protein